MVTATEWMEKGTTYFDKGKYNRAIDVYKKALDLEPENVDVLIKLGLTYRHLEAYDTAIDFYDQALNIEPDNKICINNIGWAKQLQDKMEEAIEMYKKALDIDPNYDIPLVNLTNIYFDNKEYELAIDVFNKALNIDPLNTANWIDLGRAYRFLESYDKAIEAYKKALTLDDYSKIAWNNVGWVFYCKKQYKDAIDAYTKSLKIDWLYDLPFSNLIKVYKKMIKSNDNDTVKWKNLANAFYVSKAYKRAIDSCNRSLEFNPGFDDALKLHKMILKDKTKFDMNSSLLKNIEDALDLFSTISTSVLLIDVIEFIRYKAPEIVSEFDDNEIKSKIYETIKEKGFYAKLDKKKLLFYEKPASEAKIDYMK